MPATERVRLWISYQRYALLLGFAPPVVVAALAVHWPAAWWLWGPLAVVALRLVAFAAEINGRLGRKLRATMLGTRRIAAGRFRPESVRRYCTDPCFRVVAHELLRRAGLSRAERRALTRRFADEERARGESLVLVNREDGVLFHIDGSTVTRHALIGETDGR